MEYIAIIKWIRPEDGGRIGKIPFNTEKYAPLIKYNGIRGNWSLIVNNFELIDDFTTLAKVCYLSNKKTSDDFYVGLEFELYEGNKKVAIGTIKE